MDGRDFNSEVFKYKMETILKLALKMHVHMYIKGVPEEKPDGLPWSFDL